jgi:hypothetical protein
VDLDERTLAAGVTAYAVLIERNDAMTILGRWRELSATPVDQAAESHLWRALAVLICDEAVAAAILVEGDPRVLAVAGRTVVEVTMVAAPAGVRAKSHEIEPTRARVELVETLTQVAMGGVARIRNWAFELDEDTKYAWETRQVLAGGFGNQRAVGPEERLARHLASAAGWTVPTLDTTGPDWPD